jgi:hypothetical protein
MNNGECTVFVLAFASDLLFGDGQVKRCYGQSLASGVSYWQTAESSSQHRRSSQFAKKWQMHGRTFFIRQMATLQIDRVCVVRLLLGDT